MLNRTYQILNTKDHKKKPLDEAQLCPTHQILDYLQHALLCRLHAVFGSLESDLVTLSASTRKAHHHTTVFVGKVPEDLATASHKVAVVLGVDTHVILHNVILTKHS